MAIVKFASGRGAGRGSVVDYLTRQDDRPSEPEILRGDPQRMKDLISSVEHKNKYSHAVINLTVNDAKRLTPQVERELLNKFEEFGWAGLEKERYAALWVKHQDRAGGVHYHMITPRVDLSSGKALNIAPKSWQRHWATFQDSINNRYKFDNPRDPERARSVALPGHKHALAAGQNLGPDPREVLHSHVKEKILSGVIKNREDVARYFKEAGFEVPRIGRDYITVKDPGKAKGVRLKGVAYKRGFDSSKGDFLAEAKAQEAARLASSPAKLERFRADRIKYFRERFPERSRDFSLSSYKAIEAPAKSIPRAGKSSAVRSAEASIKSIKGAGIKSPRAVQSVQIGRLVKSSLSQADDVASRSLRSSLAASRLAVDAAGMALGTIFPKTKVIVAAVKVAVRTAERGLSLGQ